VAALLCSSASGLSDTQEGIKLAERGRAPVMTIVRPADASPSQIYAAEELRDFTARLTGVRLPIISDDQPLPPAGAILLGDTRHTAVVLGSKPDPAALGGDGFRIVTRAPHLLILGSSVRGTLYGVYELLERFGGCRWYSSRHSHIPRIDSLQVPELDETSTPAFALREPFWYDMFEGDFAARSRVNGNSMRLAAKHGGHSHRFGGELWSCHTFDKLLPVAEYFEKHPEYFSEVNGRRIREQTQLCLTNPDVLRLVTANVLERIRRDPTAAFYGVSQNDWGNPCQCDTCRAIDEREGSHAGTMIEFVNRIAEAVEVEFPDAIIETLAYRYTRRPPRHVRPRHNVMPCLCTIECDFSQPLATGTYQENRDFVSDIRGWAAISKRLYIWDYTTNFRYYTAPTPNVLTLQANVQFFRENGVEYLFEQGAFQGRHADFAELKAWLLAKWLWNPDLPLEPLLQDFFAGYYGVAAPLIRTYFDELHSFHPAQRKPWRIYDEITDPVIPDDFVERSRQLWEEAEAAVADDAAISYNVRMGAVPVLHSWLARQPEIKPRKVWATSDPAQFAIPAEQRRVARTLLARMEEAGDIRLSEWPSRHDDIVSHWRFLAESEVPPPPEGVPQATVPARLLFQTQEGRMSELVTYPSALNGETLSFFNNHYEWCAMLHFDRVAFDPGRSYRLRARIAVEKTVEPDENSEAFWIGIYDPAAKRELVRLAPKVADVADGFIWYDLGIWQPAASHYFWIGPGRFDTAALQEHPGVKRLLLDQLELQQVSD